MNIRPLAAAVARPQCPALGIRPFTAAGAWVRSHAMIKRLKRLVFGLLPTEWRFSYIHSTNQWRSDESVSGRGSELASTETIRRELPRLIRELGVERIVDAPCGDFNWMRHVVDEVPVHYIGMDIVRDLIRRNAEAYESERIEFRHGNIITDAIPRADLIFCRDCFIHLSFRDTASALANLKASGSKYLLTNSYPDVECNSDIVTGQWRAMNLALPPYGYPEPLLKIREKPGKEMWLWELAAL